MRRGGLGCRHRLGLQQLVGPIGPQIQVAFFEQLDGVASNRRLDHLALRFGGLLLRQRLCGLRHLHIRGLRLLGDQRDGVEFGR